MNEQERMERRSDGGVNASRQEWSQGSRRAQLRERTRAEAEAEIAKYPKLTADEKLALFASMTGATKRQWELAASLGVTTGAYKQSLHRARKKIKEQRAAEAGQGGDDTPTWAHDDAAVMTESWKPAPKEPYNPLAGSKPGKTVHIADRVSAEVMGQDEVARIIYESELKRLGEGKRRISYAPPRETKPGVTQEAAGVTISVRSLAQDGVSARLADGTTEIRPRSGRVPEGLAYSP